MERLLRTQQLVYKNLEVSEAYSVMGRTFALVEGNHLDTKHTDTVTFTVTLCTAKIIKSFKKCD